MNHKKQNAYGTAAGVLSTIGHHPTHVDLKHDGYFLSVDNIEKFVPLDPKRWFKDGEFTLEDLEKEDQKAITDTIAKVKDATSDANLRNACNECLHVCDTLDNKILAIA